MEGPIAVIEFNFTYEYCLSCYHFMLFLHITIRFHNSNRLLIEKKLTL